MATTKVSALTNKATLTGSEEILINDGGTSKKSTVAGITLGGEVTGAVTAVTIADNIVDEANLKVSNSPTNGQFLSAQSGNTGGLTWAAAGGGGGGSMEFVSKTTISSAVSSVSITGIDSSYDRYVMKIQLKLAASNQLYLRYSQNNGSSFDTSSNYDSMGDRNGAFLYSAAAANAPLHTDGADWYISTLDLEPSLGWINASTGGIRSSNRTSNAHSSVIISHRTFSSFNALQFFASSGNISSGIITLYGIKDS